MSTEASTIAQPRPPYADYSFDFKSDAIAKYHANECNLKRTAVELNLPANTLRHWIESGIELRPQTLNALDSKLDKTVHKLIDSVYSHDLESATLQAKATAFGIVFDKLQLLRGLPTNITETVERNELTVILSSALGELPETESMDVEGRRMAEGE